MRLQELPESEQETVIKIIARLLTAIVSSAINDRPLPYDVALGDVRSLLDGAKSPAGSKPSIDVVYAWEPNIDMYVRVVTVTEPQKSGAASRDRVERLSYLSKQDVPDKIKSAFDGSTICLVALEGL